MAIRTAVRRAIKEISAPQALILNYFSKRWKSHIHAPSSSQKPDNSLDHRIRALLRETAQPVAVVTCFMPTSSSSSPSKSPPPSVPTSSTTQPFHGATLSSFTSISLFPYPLVAFSLRVPSRTATALSSSSDTSLCINLLSASQSQTARVFSRPDLYPCPFDLLEWSPTREGLPALHGSLGALSCRLIGGAWPLHDLDALGSGHTQLSGPEGEVEETYGDGVASELFIARVMRVEEVFSAEGAEDDALRMLPLLYHRKAYTTARDIPLSIPDKHDD
ncbi:hypothetical protein EW146_g6557 [Bondarzewia mesenterica]|uniref:Flavin reductase like domain-containing protein n=1 Tax=Bondarzewia mesenterica TaxID=1095465 RepID=A0A4S4LQ89_9AGAM|nr:hypothetical protein EW146_g6557 [Bondarzewia mesenterica]